jgi:hypothetical protein
MNAIVKSFETERDALYEKQMALLKKTRNQLLKLFSGKLDDNFLSLVEAWVHCFSRDVTISIGPCPLNDNFECLDVEGNFADYADKPFAVQIDLVLPTEALREEGIFESFFTRLPGIIASRSWTDENRGRTTWGCIVRYKRYAERDDE